MPKSGDPRAHKDARLKPRPDPKHRRHPLLRQRPRGVWYEDLVGIVKGYPKTQESFDLRQQRGVARFADIIARTGKHPAALTRMFPLSRPGWARHRAKRMKLWEDAKSEANECIRILIARGDMPNETEDDKLAAEAMALQMAFIRDEEVSPKLRQLASKTVLDFTKAKPTAKQEVTVKSAEDWLAGLLTEAPISE